MYFDVQVMH